MAEGKENNWSDAGGRKTNSPRYCRGELRSRRRRERGKRDENIERRSALPSACGCKWRGHKCVVRQNISDGRNGCTILLVTAGHAAPGHSRGVMVTMLGRVRACGSAPMMLMNRAETVFAAGWSCGPRRERQRSVQTNSREKANPSGEPAARIVTAGCHVYVALRKRSLDHFALGRTRHRTEHRTQQPWATRISRGGT